GTHTCSSLRKKLLADGTDSRMITPIDASTSPIAAAVSEMLSHDGISFSAFCSPELVVSRPAVSIAPVNRPAIDWQPQQSASTPAIDQATTRAGLRPLPTNTAVAMVPPAITAYRIELMMADSPLIWLTGTPWNICDVMASP